MSPGRRKNPEASWSVPLIPRLTEVLELRRVVTFRLLIGHLHCDGCLPIFCLTPCFSLGFATNGYAVALFHI